MQYREFGVTEDLGWMWPDFSGAKLALLNDGQILTYLRDKYPEIPFPGFWDLPGGGREWGESPVECALRELAEEFGLRLPHDRLRGHVFPSHQEPGLQSWMFIGEITHAEIAMITFGDEGQQWQMMPLHDFLMHPQVVPHFRDRVRLVIGRLT